jgi:hypothetical protein
MRIISRGSAGPATSASIAGSRGSRSGSCSGAASMRQGKIGDTITGPGAETVTLADLLAELREWDLVK